MTWMLPDGLEQVGDIIAAGYPLYTKSSIWYVGPDGDDTQDGLTEISAFETFDTALSAASAGDVIVLLSGYTQTATAAVDVDLDDLIIVGCGAGAAPTVEFGYNEPNAIPFTISGDRVTLCNVTFVAKSQANEKASLYVSGNDVRLRGVRVECGEHEVKGVELVITPYTVGNAGRITMDGCTVVAEGTGLDARPTRGLTSAFAQSVLVEMTGCIFDGGEYGFDEAAVDLAVLSGQYAKLRVEEMSLLRGAQFKVHASATGYVNPSTTTGGGRVYWG